MAIPLRRARKSSRGIVCSPSVVVVRVFMNLIRLVVLVFVGACGTSAASRRTPAVGGSSRALAAHPSITAETAQLQAVRAARSAKPATALPLAASRERRRERQPARYCSAETTLRIGRVIELGGKREARQTLGQAELREQEHQATKTRIDMASSTTARFIEVLARQQRLTYAEAYQASGAHPSRGCSVGKAARNPESDLQAADIAVAEAQLNRESAELELASAKMTLAASWGNDPRLRRSRRRPQTRRPWRHSRRWLPVCL